MVDLTNDEIYQLMDIVEKQCKPNYKTQDEWFNSREFTLIEKLDNMAWQNKKI